MAYIGIGIEGKGVERFRGYIYSVMPDGSRVEIRKSENLYRGSHGARTWAENEAKRAGIRLKGVMSGEYHGKAPLSIFEAAGVAV